MGRFDLLTPEEEEKYSKIIREGFDAIIKTIHCDESGVEEMKVLVDRMTNMVYSGFPSQNQEPGREAQEVLFRPGRCFRFRCRY